MHHSQWFRPVVVMTILTVVVAVLRTGERCLFGVPALAALLVVVYGRRRWGK